MREQKINDNVCRYYVGCDAIFNQANGTLESPAYGVEDYPHNQVGQKKKKIVLEMNFVLMLTPNAVIVYCSGVHVPRAPPRGGPSLYEV